MQEHIKVVTEIFDDLLVIEDQISEESRVVNLLTNPPNSYNMLLTDLEAKPEVPKIEVALSNCFMKNGVLMQTVREQ